MKKALFFSLLFCTLILACNKDSIETVDETPDTTNKTELFRGTFVGNSYNTSGTVKVVEDEAKNRFLVFENFKTDAGPDLRLYLSKDLSASSFTELSNEVKNGNYQVAIPASVNLSNQKFVLICCKQFSVLFGNAELK